MNQTTIHTEPTQYLYDSNTWLYRFMYAMFYDYIQRINYTYDAARQCSARAFGNVNYYYFSNVNYSNNISISSSWITDASCNVYTERSRSVNQFLGYLPPDSYRDGEALVDQRANGHDIRFKFTGKERDLETGFDYFGARYYDSDLSIWLSVDPMSDMYPSTSPFMYVGGNPIRLIDPDGRGIWDVINGAVRGVTDNMCGTNTRASYTPESTADYNNALNNADKVSMVAGVMMMVSGTDAAAAGVVAAPVTEGASLVVAVGGIAVAAEGSIMTINASKNLSKGNNYGEKSKTSNDKLREQAQEAKAKKDASANRTAKRKNQTAKGKNKTGNSNQNVQGEHVVTTNGSTAKGSAGGNKHTRANTRRAREQTAARNNPNR